MPSSTRIFPKTSGVLFPERRAAAFQIFQNPIELFALRFAEGIGAPNEREDLIRVRSARRAASPTMCCATTSYGFSWILIGSSARSRTSLAVTVASTRSLMFVATSTPWLSAIERMAGAPNALDRARNTFWRRHHHHQVDRADIDPHLEAGRANHRPQFAILQPVFDLEPHAAIERGVMGFDLLRQIRQQFLQAQTELFRGRAHIGENENRLPGANQLGQLRVKPHAGIARRRIGLPPNRRENFHDRFLFDLRFRDAAFAAFADQKSRQQIERRCRRRKSDAANGRDIAQRFRGRRSAPSLPLL